MVIPIPGGLGLPNLAGPIPSELAHRRRMIKLCVFALLGSLAGKLMVGILLGKPSMVGSSINVILTVIIGIFLLNDDLHLKPAYDVMMQTCCQGCADQCQGGLTCLMAWGITNAINAFCDIFLSDYITRIVRGFSGVFSPENTTGGTFTAAMFFLLCSYTLSLVAQTVGAFQAWRLQQEVRGMSEGYAGTPGNWSQEQDEPQANSGWGLSQAPAQNFQVFSGGGHRLGGE
eukprot:TRINITY_DN93943_c0_g1_i1.p1 TRINITY_DN93943_c0_g1~~TRINITY_DN93943_c0_g1_i1.p1  ORF type:complete len:242 (-),score=33.64 TRINITY_DN93943_c0_g1_i1:252-941(-)